MSLSMSSTSLSRSFVSLSSVRVVNTLDPASVLVVVLALREGSLRTTNDDRATRRSTVELLHAPSPVPGRRRRTNRCRDRRRQSVVFDNVIGRHRRRRRERTARELHWRGRERQSFRRQRHRSTTASASILRFRPPFRLAPIFATLKAPISATLITTRKGYPFAQKSVIGRRRRTDTARERQRFGRARQRFSRERQPFVRQRHRSSTASASILRFSSVVSTRAYLRHVKSSHQ